MKVRASILSVSILVLGAAAIDSPLRAQGLIAPSKVLGLQTTENGTRIFPPTGDPESRKLTRPPVVESNGDMHCYFNDVIGGRKQLREGTVEYDAAVKAYDLMTYHDAKGENYVCVLSFSYDEAEPIDCDNPSSTNYDFLGSGRLVRYCKGGVGRMNFYWATLPFVGPIYLGAFSERTWLKTQVCDQRVIAAYDLRWGHETFRSCLIEDNYIERQTIAKETHRIRMGPTPACEDDPSTAIDETIWTSTYSSEILPTPTQLIDGSSCVQM